MIEPFFKGIRRDNGEWIEGDLLHREDGKVYIKPPFASFSFSSEVNLVTVCKCSGKKDKKENLIFEHDIIKNSLGDEIGVISFGEYRNPFNEAPSSHHIGFYIDWISGRYKNDLRKELGYWLPYIEIIDNIHNGLEY